MSASEALVTGGTRMRLRVGNRNLTKLVVSLKRKAAGSLHPSGSVSRDRVIRDHPRITGRWWLVKLRAPRWKFFALRQHLSDRLQHQEQIVTSGRKTTTAIPTASR